MSTSPYFTILVPTYNHAKYVGAALDSLLAQTDPDWEAVVVNDGSTDDTPAVLAKYAERDARIRVFHKANGGTGSALNAALSHAQGQWICWLSSDDFFDPKKLATHRAWIRREPDCRFFFTYFRLFDQAKNTTVDHDLWGPLPKREFQTLGLFYRNYISGISICVQRHAWEAVGRFKESLRYAQDYDMWLRLLSRYPATFIPEWTCINRHHSGQYSEIFPQACYYDTAAAGIQFLNDHRFEQLFPLLDLRDPAAALLAVEKALLLAADSSAFLYWYGTHPNLLLRTIEWAWNRQLGGEVFDQRAPARQLIRHMLADTARRLRGTPLGWHWQVASAAVTVPDADFTYQPVSPREIGLAFLHDLRAQGKSDFADLERYFQMQYKHGLPPAPPRSACRTVVIWDTPSRPKVSTRGRELARQLHVAGCKVAILRAGPDGLHYENAIPIIATESEGTAHRVLNNLLPADALVGSRTPETLDSYPCKSHYVLSDADETAALAEQILNGQPRSRKRPSFTTLPDLAQRRKVVFLGRSPWGGGAERVVYDLLHGLDASKYELHFVHLFRANGGPAFDPTITVHDVESVLAEQAASAASPRRPFWKRLVRWTGRLVTRIGQYLSNVSQPTAVTQHLEPFKVSLEQAWPHVVALRDILRGIGSDALVIPVMEEAAIRVWLAQAFADQQYCVSLHTAESRYLPMLYPAPGRLAIESFLLSNACRNALAITIPSHGCKDDLVHHYDIPAESVEVMPNPVDVDAILTQSNDLPEIPLPAFDGKCLFVHVARLSREKDHQLLLQACRLLKQRNLDFLVACLGAGELRGEIQQQIDDYGLGQEVLLLGEVKNPFAYMARAQGLVLTSRFESFALVLVEAMVCGAVPISVDCPYGPSEVLQSGKHGLLVPMDTPEALADAMERVSRDRHLRESMRINGPERARDFDLRRIVARWEMLLDRLFDGSGRKAAAIKNAA